MTLHVERLGAGPPVVLLHGWGFHSGIWDRFAAELARESSVHLVDLPGHGLSRGCELGTLDAAVDEIAAAIPDGALVCGWSLGGLVAQRLAERHPSKTRALALIAATPRFVRDAGWMHGVEAETLESFGEDLRVDPEGTLGRFVRLNTFDVPEARSAIREINTRLRSRPWASDAALRNGLDILRTTDCRRAAHGLRIPALVVHGGRDRIVPPGAGRWLAEELSNATLLELPASAHLPFVTDRAAVLDAFRIFHG
jgi:pimeloyl-[acyl-carrier protein] methyl ester esterase